MRERRASAHRSIHGRSRRRVARALQLVVVRRAVRRVEASGCVARLTVPPSLARPDSRSFVKTPIRVLALSPIPEEGAGCRFRIAQFIPYLRSVGIDVT